MKNFCIGSVCTNFEDVLLVLYFPLALIFMTLFPFTEESEIFPSGRSLHLSHRPFSLL